MKKNEKNMNNGHMYNRQKVPVTANTLDVKKFVLQFYFETFSLNQNFCI